MLKKISYLVSVITLFLVIGCEDESVAPSNASSNKITGETFLVESSSAGTFMKIKSGASQLSKQVAVFNDISNNELLSGVRTVEVSKNYILSGEEHNAGSFSLETKGGYWEGGWTGTTTPEGTTILAVGYNFDDRDQSCEWRYYFPSSLEGKRGTYSAHISSNRF